MVVRFRATQKGMPLSTSDDTTDSTGSIPDQDTMEEYLHLIEIGEHAQRSTFSSDSEFEFGLDLILDALEGIATPDGH